MNQEIKQKWVEALRSGEYEQGDGRLVSVIKETGKPKYCCLGVLCDLYIKENPAYSWTKTDKPQYSSVVYDSLQLFDENLYLPQTVMDWAGIDTKTGVFLEDDGVQQILSSLNDNGVDFEKISKKIEKYF